MEENMEKLESTSLDIEKVNIEKLKQLFPNVVTDRRIDFDMLRAILGEEIEESREKYQFIWNGKGNAIKIAQSPSTSTLRPLKEKSKDWDFTQNLYIEGDNLEVLKQLQKTYHGKIKLIYIDPPYNTGSDFVYKDDFKNSINNYEEQTEQSLKSNPETNGRFHTNWLNMMYPRLILARQLLSNDGAIFISIDDNEQDNLKKICSEIFGENNFLGQIIWERAFSPKNDAKYFSASHDYVIAYAKSISDFKIGKLPRTEEMNSRYKNPDSDPKGPWSSGDLTAKTYSAAYDYPIVTPSGKSISPTNGRSWITSRETMQKWIDEGRIWFGEHGDNTPRYKRYLSEMTDGIVPTTLWKYEEVGHSQEGRQELKKLFNNKGYFDGPKPLRLLDRIITVANLEDDSIVLDFFSGSASTAHAVLRRNSEQAKNVKFILVQLPEKCEENSDAYKDGLTNICDIGEERIRCAGEQIKKEWEEKQKKEGLFVENDTFPVDIGFKVFKLDSSNIEAWDNERELNNEGLLKYSNEVFKEGRSKEDVLYEIMLKYGIFDREVSEIDINGKTMYQVGKRYMIVCLEDDLDVRDIVAIGQKKPNTVVFKESGFKNDNDKINAVYNLKKQGVEDIKCI